MNRKIKITIETIDHQLKLPALSLNLAWLFIKSGLWQNSSYVKNEPEVRELLLSNKELIINATQQLMTMLNAFEPFVIVEIVSKTDHILIELK